MDRLIQSRFLFCFQYEAAKTADIPEMDQLIVWLNANLPPDAEVLSILTHHAQTS